MLLPSTTVFCRLLVFLLVPVMLSRRLPFKKSLSSFCLPFLCRFLLWKDRKGQTTVHKSTCQFFGRKGSFSCLCPTHLTYGTVDSLIGKLRALFNESGRRGEWDPRLLIGNPATDISLKQYLKAVYGGATSSPNYPYPGYSRFLSRSLASKPRFG